MKISNETKVGVLAAIAITVLILGYSYLKSGSLFSSTNSYYAIYKNASGLGKSDDVLIKGYEVGKVTNMELIPDSVVTIKVTIAINKDIKIPKGSEMRIINADLLGEKAVEIVLGHSDTILEPGSELKSSIEPTLTESVTIELLPVKNKFEQLIRNIDSVIAVIQVTFGTRFQESVDENLASIREALDNFKNITLQVDEILAAERQKLDTIITNISAISTNLKENRENIDRAFTNLASFSDSLAAVNLVQTMHKLDAAINDITAMVDTINYGQSSLGSLINDREFYDKLVQATANLDSLIIDLNKNPRRYIPPLIQLRSREK